ncbi:MAG: hypothetical protein N2035_06260 [Chthoniobacterales bacterium]|nr:hypothetical protein [Chthoniobacterales bacterium]
MEQNKIIEQVEGGEKKNLPSNIAYEDLRRRARGLLELMEIELTDETARDEIGSLYHNLMEFQIELDLQQDEIAQGRQRIESLLQENYVTFELAPFCYWKVDEFGMVLQFNLMGAELFGKPRKYLVPGRTPLSLVIAQEDHHKLNLFIKRIFSFVGVVKARLKNREGEMMQFFGREIQSGDGRKALVAGFLLSE